MALKKRKAYPMNFIPFLMMILLLAGCTPGQLMIKEADLRRLELRMEEQEVLLQRLGEQEALLQRLEYLSEEQADNQSALLESHQEMLFQLQTIAVKQEVLAERQLAWESLIRTLRLPPRTAEAKGASKARQSPEIPRLSDKQMVGSVEKVFLSPPGAMLPARIDTGATTSSLDARNIEHFERNGERWVRFAMINPDDDSKITLECKVVRNVRIIQAVVEEAERRPVVELGVTVGKTTQTAQFTLSDRRHLEYPVLIGRNILMDVMVVDVSRSHIAPPQLPPDLSDRITTP
jgi:hypothetical protein